MKKQLFRGLIIALLTGCAPAAPIPTPTHTPIPLTETPTAIPTPKVETAPAGTTEKNDVYGNKYAVDAEGKPTHWYNTETNKYEPFQPIDFNNPEGLQIIEQEVVFTSGWYKQEINRAISEGLWTPPNPDIHYLKAGEWFVDEKTGKIPYDDYGRQYLFIPSDENITYDKYPLQPTEIVQG